LCGVASTIEGGFFLRKKPFSIGAFLPRQPENCFWLQKRKEPPGNRAALSSGRIVPTEAKPSELSGCIVGAGDGSVKEKSMAK
jgi:hypothetical protein